jgi:hypothetical protein
MSLLRKSGMTAGSCLFIVGLIAMLAYFGIVRLITGHNPEYAAYMVWGYIAISIFGEAYIELQKSIGESTKEIKEEIKRLEIKIDEIESNLETERINKTYVNPIDL